jgi:hypothetical protein
MSFMRRAGGDPNALDMELIKITNLLDRMTKASSSCTLRRPRLQLSHASQQSACTGGALPGDPNLIPRERHSHRDMSPAFTGQRSTRKRKALATMTPERVDTWISGTMRAILIIACWMNDLGPI